MPPDKKLSPPPSALSPLPAKSLALLAAPPIASPALSKNPKIPPRFFGGASTASVAFFRASDFESFGLSFRILSYSCFTLFLFATSLFFLSALAKASFLVSLGFSFLILSKSFFICLLLFTSLPLLSSFTFFFLSFPRPSKGLNAAIPNARIDIRLNTLFKLVIKPSNASPAPSPKLSSMNPLVPSYAFLPHSKKVPAASRIPNTRSVIKLILPPMNARRL